MAIIVGGNIRFKNVMLLQSLWEDRFLQFKMGVNVLLLKELRCHIRYMALHPTAKMMVKVVPWQMKFMKFRVVITLITLTKLSNSFIKLAKKIILLFNFIYLDLECRDINSMCSGWKEEGYCNSPDYWNFMKKNCKHSCNLCGQLEAVEPRSWQFGKFWNK